MAALLLKAHYDGEHIQLDEPCTLTKGCELIVTVLPTGETLEQWRSDFYRIASHGLARAYGDNEPEYTEADIIP